MLARGRPPRRGGTVRKKLTAEEAKSCPFCASKNLVLVENECSAYVMCQACGARGPKFVGCNAQPFSVLNWNLRRENALEQQ